ncbi:MAG: hypothetical protein M1816_001274 [Peltula sp. TS41687]|nr:MAG: hypothetical protein M1816_001274 [Peltula sp. TS41687]
MAALKVTQGSAQHPMITGFSVPPDGTTVIVKFGGPAFTFHAQWLHDAQCEYGSSRDASGVFCQLPDGVRIREVSVLGSGTKTSLEVVWENGKHSRYPAIWLRVLSSVVAKTTQHKRSDGPIIPRGWLAKTLVIPEICYEAISREGMSNDELLATKAWIVDALLLESRPGILKITNLPPVDSFCESSQRNNLLTQILKRLFGSVFQHPRRGPDETFKIASYYHESASRAVELPNYDTSEILLPHTDHSHYDNPVRVQGLHAVEGTSENTFVDAFTALATLREEDEDLFDALCDSPMILGRVAQFYNPAFVQTTVDTAVRMTAGFPQKVKGVRWHPHLVGYLLSSFETYEKARKAHCKFQEIMQRDSHMLRLEFRPGDLYLWDNFRILHGRQKIFNVPRLAIGQTVIEQTVSDEYRAVKTDWLKDFLDEHWLVQTPTALLNDMVELVSEEMGDKSIS